MNEKQEKSQLVKSALYAYKWLDSLFMSLLIVIVVTLIHPLILPVIGMLLSFDKISSLNKYYRFTMSYTMWVYLLTQYVIFKDGNNFLLFEIANILFLFVFYQVHSKYLKGKTIWN